MHRLFFPLCVHLHLPVSAEPWTLFTETPLTGCRGVGDGGRGQDFKSPGAAKNRVRGKARGYKPGLDGKESSKQSTLDSLSVGTPVASLVNVPAFDVSLTHEISLQLGDHDADDPDEDKKVDLQGTRAGGGGGWELSFSLPVISLVTVQVRQLLLQPPNSVTYPDSKENG